MLSLVIRDLSDAENNWELLHSYAQSISFLLNDQPDTDSADYSKSHGPGLERICNLVRNQDSSLSQQRDEKIWLSKRLDILLSCVKNLSECLGLNQIWSREASNKELLSMIEKLHATFVSHVSVQKETASDIKNIYGAVFCLSEALSPYTQPLSNTGVQPHCIETGSEVVLTDWNHLIARLKEQTDGLLSCLSCKNQAIETSLQLSEDLFRDLSQSFDNQDPSFQVVVPRDLVSFYANQRLDVSRLSSHQDRLEMLLIRLNKAPKKGSTSFKLATRLKRMLFQMRETLAYLIQQTGSQQNSVAAQVSSKTSISAMEIDSESESGYSSLDDLLAETETAFSSIQLHLFSGQDPVSELKVEQIQIHSSNSQPRPVADIELEGRAIRLQRRRALSVTSGIYRNACLRCLLQRQVTSIGADGAAKSIIHRPCSLDLTSPSTEVDNLPSGQVLSVVNLFDDAFLRLLSTPVLSELYHSLGRLVHSQLN
ncbi:unnamed protein product, partial [Protopolystoma xenopodis]